MPRGRPPRTRGVYSFEDDDWAPPEYLVLDTSVVIEAVLKTQPHHAACLKLIERLAGAQTRVLVSDMIVPEFAEGVYKIVLRERHAGRWRTYWTDGRARRRATRLYEAAWDGWQEMLDTLAWGSVPLSEASKWVGAMMSAFGLHSYDAAHAGAALAAGAEDLATLDTGFGRVMESVLSIHTVSAKVSRTRKLRPAK